MDGPSQYIRAVREAYSVNVSDVPALFIPHILVEEPRHPGQRSLLCEHKSPQRDGTRSSNEGGNRWH